MKLARDDDFGFLGEEFLLWLWFCAEQRGGLHSVAGAGDGDRVGIAIDKALEFYDESGGVKVAVRGDAPTRAPESREALRRGMRIARAGLIVTVGGDNAQLVLDGRTFELRSAKGEKAEGETVEERDQAALATLFGLADAIERVYREFLLERAAPGFSAGLGAELRRWARSEKSRPEPRRAAAAD